MSDRVIPLTDLTDAGYTADDLRQLGVVIRTGHNDEPCCDRDDLQAHGINVPKCDED